MIYFIFTFFTIVPSVLSFDNEECSPPLSITRNLNKSGFHREISYSLELITSGQWGDCRIILEQSIPNGLFVNKNQIDDLERFGKISANINGTNDIEKPQTESEGQIVQIYMNLTHEYNILTSSVELPIHFRYHESQPGGGYKKAYLSSPLVFMNCQISPLSCERNDTVQLPFYPQQPDCDFFSLNYNINLEVLEVEIPVGDTNDYYLVFSITLFVTSVGTLYIIYIIVKNKP